jgi:polyhydroxyalkanoate synthesis repressor PhaR
VQKNQSPRAKQPQTDNADASSVRIIKKYPNRRLYDTQTSSYITLADVRQLVMGSANFSVRDAKSGEDLTRSILLQIILEEESSGAPLFSEGVLANIIRFYGNAMQSFMGGYLEKNIQNFMDMQAKIAQQSQPLSPEKWTQLMGKPPVLVPGALGGYLEQSKASMAQMQEQMREQMQRQTEQMLAAFGLKP